MSAENSLEQSATEVETLIEQEINPSLPEEQELQDKILKEEVTDTQVREEENNQEIYTFLATLFSELRDTIIKHSIKSVLARQTEKQNQDVNKRLEIMSKKINKIKTQIETLQEERANILSEIEKRENRRCFKCKQPGHLKKDCPLAPPGSKQLPSYEELSCSSNLLGYESD